MVRFAHHWNTGMLGFGKMGDWDLYFSSSSIIPPQGQASAWLQRMISL
jgi:hypothetical protein